MELGYSALTRRERIERIAMAERDRRAGRIDVAIAALGEASEWPARVVLALAKLADSEAPETRRILEEGLDSWVFEVGLAAFDMPLDASSDLAANAANDLDRPIDQEELETAFAEAEAQTDEMFSANHVAERVLMDEPVGLAELNGDMLSLVEEARPVEAAAQIAMDAASVEDRPAVEATPASGARSEVVAILEGWLQNLEASRAGRAQ